MFALRRIPTAVSRPVSVPSLKKGNLATLTSALHLGEATPSPPPPSATNPTKLAPKTTSVDERIINSVTQQTQGRQKRKKGPVHRAPISNDTPRLWNRPIAPGVLPAYDLGLKLIREDSARIKEEMIGLKIQMENMEQEILAQGESAAGAKQEMLTVLKERYKILEIQSEINLPHVRWRVANAMVDMNKPVERHLLEQRWRKDGKLDLLMERVHQMHVVPDVLPSLHPTIDLRVVARLPHRDSRKTGKSQVNVEPGIFLRPEQTTIPPRVFATIFHPDKRLYTMLLVDPDVPDEENASFITYLHWMKPNISLSAMHDTRISGLNTHTTYVPPHPQRGTPYHRYTLLLLPQPNTTELEIPVVPVEERRDFDLSAFLHQWGLDGSRGGGAHMWREVWDKRVSLIYQDVLCAPEPQYSRPPKSDPYADAKKTQKYVL